MTRLPDTHWSAPGAYPVGDGVHRIPLPLPMDGLKAVNVYVVETEAGMTCIDGGWAIAVARRQFEESLRAIGYEPTDITSFLVTHAHRDHYTQAVAIRSEFNRAVVHLGLGEQPSIELLAQPGQKFGRSLEGLRLAGADKLADEWATLREDSSSDTSIWLMPDIWLEGDQEIRIGSRRIRAVSTPGHTSGHYVFADPDAGLLFAGDHVLPTITPSIGFEPHPSTQPLGDYLASLTKVRALPDMQLLPAHGEAGMSTHARIDQLLGHHDDRLALCLQAIRRTGSTAHEVAQRLPWTRHERMLDELDTFNAGLATLETLIHLDLLWSQGRVDRTAADGVLRYDLPHLQQDS